MNNMMWLFLLGSFLISVLMGMVVIPNILIISHKKRLFDMPDERKSHTIPVPRLGGLSFFPVVLVSLCITMGIGHCSGLPVGDFASYSHLSRFLFLAAGCMILFLVGAADDLVGVNYRYKFATQIVSASLLVSSGEWINSLNGLFGIYEIPIWVGIPLTVFVVVYITNAINLTDGIDGLASGLSCIALVTLGIFYILGGNIIYAILALSTLGVLLPFWCYNVFGNEQRGHKLFMGDAGSLTLGYILSFLVIHLSVTNVSHLKAGNFEMIAAFSTLAVPLLDVIRVVFHRLRTGKHPFLPDKNHFHHKLLRTGMRTRTTLATILFIALFFIGMNILLSPLLHITLLLVLNVLLWTLMQLAINRRIKLKTN